MDCVICSSPISEPVAELFGLPSVASDCRPWSTGRSVQICSGCGVMKRVTNENFNHDIYKEYTSYPEPTGRTKKILEFVKDRVLKPKTILDIGCGKGDGLITLANKFPLAKVSGYEPTVHQERPKGKFDLITLFHVFEHVKELHEMLAYIKSSLTENGHVLIQVPYAAMWPFDLIIADHEWHFTPKALLELMYKCGFHAISIENEPIKKEITVLANLIEPINYVTHITWGHQYTQAKDCVDWLLNFKRKLDKIDTDVAVYGTSVSAMWVGNILGDKVVCYIDDDETRWGTFNGKPAKGMQWMDKGDAIVTPFPDWQLTEIKAKNPQLRFL